MGIKKIIMNKELKNKIIDYTIIFVFTLLVFYNFFLNRIYVGNDLTYHLNRIIGCADAFKEGQILPKIYPYTNNGFGYASPLFYCDLFLYPFSLLYILGADAVISYKVCVIFYTLLGNIFIYIIIKEETNNRVISLLSVLLYLTANYHLQNIFIRSSLGEVIAMTFVPLAIHSIYKILVKHEDWWIYLGISFSLLVMSHLITTLLYGIFFFVMIIVFIIINRKDKQLIKKSLITILKGTILALLLTAWYLLPMLEQLHSQEFWLSYNENELVYSNQSLEAIFRFNVVDNIKDFEMNNYASAGLFLIILAIISVIIKNNKYVTIIFSFCIVLYLIILGIIPGSYLKYIQFYSRLYVVTIPMFIICVINFLISNENRKYAILVLVCGLIYGGINTFKLNDQLINNGDYYLNNSATLNEINNVKTYLFDLDYNHDELSGAEYLPFTTNINYNTFSKTIKYIDEDGNLYDYIDDYERSYTSITFEYNDENNRALLLPLSYYKGYKTYELINGNWEEKELVYSPTYKLLVVDTEVGKHTYNVRYVGTRLQMFSLICSSISLIYVILKINLNKSLNGKI